MHMADSPKTRGVLCSCTRRRRPASMLPHNVSSTNMEESCKSPILHEPRRNSQIKRLTRTFSLDTTTSTATWYSGTGSLLKIGRHEEDPPAHYETHLCTVGFIFKIVQWSLCILCAGLFFEASGLIHDFKKQLFPYIVYWTYMMITGVIILSYLLGQKMREILIRIYNIIGAIMFLITAIVLFYIVTKNWKKWNEIRTESLPTAELPKKQNSPSTRTLAKMLMTQSILCFLNSMAYFSDTAYSLYVSYKTVRLDIVQEKTT